jgi:hypothetical protein
MTIVEAARLGRVGMMLGTALDGAAPAIQTAPASPGRGPGAWSVAAGARVSLLRSAGYDAFSTNDVLAQFSATALRSFSLAPGFATAVGLQWEGGSTAAQARGGDASLSLSRAAVVVEGRFVPRAWLYGFARLAPGWLYGSARLQDRSTVTPLETSLSSFSLDASGGAAARLNPRSQPVGLWVLAEAGYGWARASAVRLAPALPEADSDKAGVTPLADLAARGAFFRFSLALDY